MDLVNAKILVCIQHTLTDEQKLELNFIYNKEYGMDIRLIFLSESNPSLFAMMANSPNNYDDLESLAGAFVKYALDYQAVILPLGSPALMFMIAQRIGALDPVGQTGFLFSHSERVSIDTPSPDGSVSKSSVFNHHHFIFV